MQAKQTVADDNDGNTSCDVRIRRVYEEPSADDGLRVLVDRLWPRGRSKQSAHVDVWIKDIAPSKELRTWFGHIPERFDEFASRYREELNANPEAVSRLRELIAGHPRVTLLYGAKDNERNNAVVLRDYLRDQPISPSPLPKDGD
ncbi:DUF488 domain-containing protein [Bifidobacterium thermacidophilum]|uniref:DUF488 domain-containing protein n=1 Tax=Bifidobacterium thermacidophilum TaxID=246618 RepID=UPI003F08B1B2